MQWAVAAAAAGLASGRAIFGGSIIEKAAHAERMQCDATTAQDEVRVLQTTLVLQVEGRYAYHESGIGKVTATRVVL